MNIKHSEKPNNYLIAGLGIFLFLMYYLFEIYFEEHLEITSELTLVKRAFLLGLFITMIMGLFEYLIKGTFYSSTTAGVISWYIGQVIATGITTFLMVNYFEGFPAWVVADLFLFLLVYGLVVTPLIVVFHLLFNKVQTTGFNEELSFIVIKANDATHEMLVDPREILFVMTEDQSIRVFYIEEGMIMSKLIGQKLIDFERRFSDIPFLIRCHQAYIVNVSRVSEVVTEKQNLLLHFSSQYVIPVEEKFRNRILAGISR